MATTRTPRGADSREINARDTYRPPSLLPTPNPQPGFAYRWVATHSMGQADATNVSRKRREGWEPVKAEDHPELEMGDSGNVEIGGLILMKMATEKVEGRKRYYEKAAATQMQSVEQSYLQQNDARMPKFRNVKSKVSKFGNGDNS
jgi:hypothetical protein